MLGFRGRLNPKSVLTRPVGFAPYGFVELGNSHFQRISVQHRTFPKYLNQNGSPSLVGEGAECVGR